MLPPIIEVGSVAIGSFTSRRSSVTVLDNSHSIACDASHYQDRSEEQEGDESPL
jgi:hypothetical protein